MTKLEDSSQLPRYSYHRFYVDKFRLLSTTAQSINEEIEELRNLAPLRFKGLIKSELIKSLVKPPKNSVPRKTGVIYLTDQIVGINPIIRPDQNRCQKRLIHKGEMDLEYLQQVQEELLSSKKNGGMTSCGTQQLNDLINSMAQRIQHGSKNRKEEMKIHDKLRDLKITRDMYTAPEPISIPILCYYDGALMICAYWEKNARAGIRYHDYRRKELKNFEILRKDLRGYKIKVKRLLSMLHDVKKAIFYLEKDLAKVNSERRIIYNLIRMLRQLQESCDDAYQSLTLNVGNVGVDVAKVKQLCDTKVEEFKARWNENEAFRDDLY